MSLKSIAAAVLLAASLAQPALADRFVGFGRNVIVAPFAPYAAPVFYPPPGNGFTFIWRGGW